MIHNRSLWIDVGRSPEGNDMDIRQLEMFLAVVESGGYTKAGEQLHVAHSAIHRQIKMLEYEFRVQLLKRHGKQLKLTPMGSVVLKHAQRILNEIVVLKHHIDELTGKQEERLRIGTATATLASFLPTVLARFRRQYPKVELQGVAGNADNLIEEVQKGNMDLAIVVVPPSLLDEGSLKCNYEPLFKEEFVLALNKRHPLAKRASIQLKQMLKFPLIMYSKGSYIRRLLDGMFEAAGETPTISMELENESFIEKMIEINLGVAFLSKHRVTSDKLNYVKIKGHPIYLEIGLVYQKTDYVPRTAREFARICRDVSAQIAGTNRISVKLDGNLGARSD